ncbi:MAG: AAA family ATPase [Paracoccus denitrificans]|uniref:AAA family ATPase n=1 Tax=Paracoccus denitrificans TaxID=266 RepID=A0A533HW08_PARDE|nr:MAG: AAA family ATPase [Paracoccus denitrificans]
MPQDALIKKDAPDADQGNPIAQMASPNRLTDPSKTPAPLDTLLTTPGYPHLPQDLAEEIRAGGGDPEATLISGETRRKRLVSTSKLVIDVRLAATFGSEKGFHAAFQPGAITVISGVAASQVSAAVQTLSGRRFSQRREITTQLHDTVPRDALLLVDCTVEEDASSYDRQRAQQRIDLALSRDAALLILVGERHDLPESLHDIALTHLPLAPLSAELLIALLRHSHSATGRIDEAAVRAALPDDDRLAGIDERALQLALRAPTPREVAHRLTRMNTATTRPSTGPTLDQFTGDSPGLIAARRLVADLQSWQRGDVTWSELSRSMLLYGPPGTGKTYLARAMGNSAGIATVTASFAEWQSAGHLGHMLREMRQSFAAARRQAPAILIIDEIDAVGSRVDADDHGRSYRTQVVNGFLGEMDAIARDEGVLVVACCNHPELVDPAVLRPGRFDLKISVSLPDAATIFGILNTHLHTAFPEDTLRILARQAVGQSAAEIDAAIRAARAEARHDGTALTPAMLRRHLGVTDDGHTQNIDRRIAIHECGHAIVCAALGRGTVTRVLVSATGGEIYRRGGAHQGLRADHEAELSHILAGRAAERLVLGQASSGAGGNAQSDLALATNLALAIDTSLGLGSEGLIWSDTPPTFLLRDPGTRNRIRLRLENAEKRAIGILQRHEQLLRAMADQLRERREFNEDEIGNWLRRVMVDGPPDDDAEGLNEIGATSRNQADHELMRASHEPSEPPA